VPALAGADQYWRGYADALRAARKVHWHTRLAGYERPVLVLNGSRDTTHLRDQERILEGARDGRTQVIEGAGHLANLDRRRSTPPPSAPTRAGSGERGARRQ
jgi:hypothetical protein